MPARYLLADYLTKKGENPRVAIRMDDLEDGKKAFKNSSQRKIKSAVLFDTEKNEVVLVAIEGEPIHLVNIIEFARIYGNTKSNIDMEVAKAKASILIREIVKAMAGEPIPGVGGAGIAHVLHPYYALEGDGNGDGANVAKGAAILWGGIAGAIVGTVAAGPVGGIIGGIAGVVAGAGAKNVAKASTHPRQCKTCQGTGLVDDLRRCSTCNGYGYRK